MAVARLARFARRALGRIAADLRLQLYDVEEDVGLAAQLGGNHRRLRRDGGDHGHAHAASLHRLDQRAEVAAFPQRRSSNASSLCAQNSAGSPQICALLQRDNLWRDVMVMHSAEERIRANAADPLN